MASVDFSSWEQGIIAKIESFILNRYPVGAVSARAVATSINSMGLLNAALTNKYGVVRPNIWYFNIGESGFGFKTPVIRFIRRVMNHYNSELLAVTSFTCEGMTEYITGTRGKSKGDEIPPHYSGFLVRDEFSTLLGDIYAKRYNVDMLEFLSQLWDCYLEGRYTKSYKYEGNLRVYYSAYMTGSPFFYQRLEESFFTQGLGNRPLWVIEEPPKPTKLNETFFYDVPDDPEEDALIKDIVNCLWELQKAKYFVLAKSADQLWREHEYEMKLKAYNDGGHSGLLLMKIGYNTLKLAMNYAASYRPIHPQHGAISIPKTDMQRAINDMAIHFEMWRKAMGQWGEIILDTPTETHTSDFRKLLREIRRHKGIVKRSTAYNNCNWLVKKFDEILDTLVKMQKIKVFSVQTSAKKRTQFFVEWADPKYKHINSGETVKRLP
jgi:hypothetical protein